MQNLFNAEVYNQVIDRMKNLAPDAQPLWGKMNVAQMLAHCRQAFKVPLSQKKLHRIFIGRLIGWMFKSKLYNDDPWKQNLPTAPSFIIKGDRDFDLEKAELTKLINKFYSVGPMGITKYPHPMFGKLTPEQWGQAMFKHVDHHLRQFGV